jgi:hypothetical protein
VVTDLSIRKRVWPDPQHCGINWWSLQTGTVWRGFLPCEMTMHPTKQTSRSFILSGLGLKVILSPKMSSLVKRIKIMFLRSLQSTGCNYDGACCCPLPYTVYLLKQLMKMQFEKIMFREIYGSCITRRLKPRCLMSTLCTRVSWFLINLGNLKIIKQFWIAKGILWHKRRFLKFCAI